MENSLAPAQHEPLDTEELVKMFEEAEDATSEARAAAERDRDYVDNKQLTPEEMSVLKDRRQPAIFVNRIKRKIDSLRGHEITSRIKPRALPRTPKHEHDAQGIEQALRFVMEDQFYWDVRSSAWYNLLVEGVCGIEVTLEQGRGADLEVKIQHIPWDRIFYDPHSSRRDFSDANYLGMVLWRDLGDAKMSYPDAESILTATMSSYKSEDTYGDKPSSKIWADRVRRRVRICQIWYKKGEKWCYAEFTKGGTLKSGESPYVNDKGESECPLILASAYIDRENNRYGVVREMIPIQDEINKRRSKALHLLNSTQIIAEDGAVKDIKKFRSEMARPDGVGELTYGSIDKIKVETRTDLADGHISLMQESKNEIDQMAGNIALQGNALNKSAASGKAIIASQNASILDIMPIMDQLRSMDLRGMRAVYSRIRQGWTAEKWVRITDDERNIKWVGLNVDPQIVRQRMDQNPDMQQRIAGLVGNIAELDCDIIIEDMPDGVTPQLEQFQSLIELKKMDTNNEIPFRALLLAAPNLKNKDQIIGMMDGNAEQNQQKQAQERMQMEAAQMQMQAAQSDIEETQANIKLKLAQAEKFLQDAQKIASEAVVNSYQFQQSQPVEGFYENSPPEYYGR